MARFLSCECGNLVAELNEGKGKITCCDKPMEEALIHKSDESGHEKHTPLVHEEDGKVYVKVGESVHPMDENHYIDWVYLLTDKGSQRKHLHPGNKPEVIFLIDEDEVVLEVVAHCSQHGLWSADLD
jgi:superoxide reductase